MAFSGVSHIELGYISGYGPNRTLKVVLRSGQILGTPVQYSYDGFADQLLINQKPLPRIGTWGIIGFLYNDDRNAVWLKSIYIQQNNAIVYGTPDDNFTTYETQMSGAYTYKDSSGTEMSFFADGSYLLVSSANTPPVIYQNVIQNGTVEQVEVPSSSRITQSAMNFNLNHSSGTDVLIDSSGNATLTMASGATFEVKSSSGTYYMKLDSSGNLTFVGETVNASTPAGNDLLLDSSGNATLTAPVITLAGNVVIEGSLSAGGSTGASASFSGPVSATGNITSNGDVKAGSISLQNHVHPYYPGTGTETDTGTPTG